MPAPVVPEEAKCWGCGYALRGLADFRCPECGRPFDPASPDSMNLGRPVARVSRAALEPIGRWAHELLRILIVAGVLGPAWLAPSHFTAVLWLVLWAFFITACWIRSSLRYSVVLFYGLPRAALRVDDRFRRKTRIAFVVVALLVVTHAPFCLALLLSRPVLDRYAYHLWAEVPATAPSPKGPVVRGLVLLWGVEALNSRVTLRLPGGGWISCLPTEDGQRLRLDWSTWNLRGW